MYATGMLAMNCLSLKHLIFVCTIMNQGEEGVTYDGPYLPLWQIQPTISEFESPYNWDGMSVPSIPGQERRAAEVVMQEHKPLISAPYLLADISRPEQYQQDQDEALWISSYVPQLDFEEVMRPMFDFQFPILADAYNKIQWMDGTYSTEDHKVVALLSISIYWSYMISDILPQGSSGVLVVFESACTQTFTYEVNGPHVVYLGAGEYHDSKYDHMAIGSLVSDLRFFSNHLSTYSGLPLQDSFCPMYVSVHASAKMEAIYTSNTPWIFALVTACVFLLTVLAFIVYNYVVEQRQKVVLKSAGAFSNKFYLRWFCFIATNDHLHFSDCCPNTVTSNAIVSSLFPEAVKKQLMETQANEQLSDDTLPKGKLKTFLNDGNKNDNAIDDTVGGSDEFAIKNAKQIAELFPETTIMFADIAGFTAWASSREPSHVFTLLETLYGAFDRQAKRMGEF
jgi:Adenylate and Guanylate cyclase catalytic domain